MDLRIIHENGLNQAECTDPDSFSRCSNCTELRIIVGRLLQALDAVTDGFQQEAPAQLLCLLSENGYTFLHCLCRSKPAPEGSSSESSHRSSNGNGRPGIHNFLLHKHHTDANSQIPSDSISCRNDSLHRRLEQPTLRRPKASSKGLGPEGLSSRLGVCKAFTVRLQPQSTLTWTDAVVHCRLSRICHMVQHSLESHCRRHAMLNTGGPCRCPHRPQTRAGAHRM